MYVPMQTNRIIETVDALLTPEIYKSEVKVEKR